ncbi:hypothetical protein [Streptomyces sp. HPF1205]|uniref:hypothetical protein n=1 Tax=Streptomyces sp. HPF1205 TaxID=2873262 RepID=UPI001CECCC22|nr:hypothetical protein [Streptomyces sp. HPF1205]
MTAVSLAWTTAGIGALLVPVAPTLIAYGAAAIFDTAWLACQVVEWLERYDPERAKGAHMSGWFALLLAVAAIVTHGLTSGNAVAGAVGAAVSLIAKGLWVIVLRHYAVPLGPRVTGWLLQRRRELAAQRALAAALRRLDIENACTEAVFGTSARAARQATVDCSASLARQPDTAADMTVTPAASADGAEHTLAQFIRPLSPSSPPSIANTVRACLSEGITSDIDIIARVREVHGDRQNLVDTVARTRRRVDRAKAS